MVEFNSDLIVKDVYNLKFEDGYCSVLFTYQLVHFKEIDHAKEEELRLLIDEKDFKFIVVQDCMWDSNHKLIGYSPLFSGRWAAGCDGVHIVTSQDLCFSAKKLKKAIDMIDKYERSNEKCTKYL